MPFRMAAFAPTTVAGSSPRFVTPAPADALPAVRRAIDESAAPSPEELPIALDQLPHEIAKRLELAPVEANAGQLGVVIVAEDEPDGSLGRRAVDGPGQGGERGVLALVGHQSLDRRSRRFDPTRGDPTNSTWVRRSLRQFLDSSGSPTRTKSPSPGRTARGRGPVSSQGSPGVGQGLVVGGEVVVGLVRRVGQVPCYRLHDCPLRGCLLKIE